MDICDPALLEALQRMLTIGRLKKLDFLNSLNTNSRKPILVIILSGYNVFFSMINFKANIKIRIDLFVQM